MVSFQETNPTLSPTYNIYYSIQSKPNFCTIRNTDRGIFVSQVRVIRPMLVKTRRRKESRKAADREERMPRSPLKDNAITVGTTRCYHSQCWAPWAPNSSVTQTLSTIYRRLLRFNAWSSHWMVSL